MNPSIFVASTFHLLAAHRLALPSRACSFISTNYRRSWSGPNRRGAGLRLISTSMADNGAAVANGHGAGTRYRVAKAEKGEWVRISFDASEDTTSKALQMKQSEQKTKAADVSTPQESSTQGVPESVLQYQRQKRKMQAANRASKTNVNVGEHLRTVYSDEQIVVANKPSGILCVPGVNKHKSLLDLVYDVYGSKSSNGSDGESPEAEPLKRDSMIVHRLDMDTSGIVLFARTRLAMSKLHESFREKSGTKKVYEALLVGWLDVSGWVECATAEDGNGDSDILKGGAVNLGGGEINLPLQRDHRHPPFMRVSTPESEAGAREAVKDLNHAGYKKLVAKRPKPSTTRFRVLSHEKWEGHPVTRVELIPVTGRTHQLRVHMSALGHPIVGDPAYGYCGEAHPNGGFDEVAIREMSPTCASLDLRKEVEESVQESGRTMCLHARRLTVDHPVTKEAISFEAAPSF